MFYLKSMKKIIFKFLNSYSIIYVPIGLVIFLLLLNELISLPLNMFLVFFVLFLIFYSLKLYTSKRNNQSSLNSVFKFSIIEFYSDYWLGCTASKLIVNEFQKKFPEINFISINASKDRNHEYIKKYNLKYTPSYVLVDKNFNSIAKRVGSFNSNYFLKKLNY